MPETTDPQPDLPARLEAVLTERFTELGNPFSAMRRHEKGPDGWPASHPVGPHQVAEVLRELLPAAPADEPAAPADEPADRPAILREAADLCDEAGAVYASKALNDHADGAFALMERFLRKADEAEYVATPCSLPNVCEDGGEPCSTHERLMAHAEGDHELCAPDCGTSAVEAPAPNRAGGEGRQREAEVPRPAPTGPAPTALRVRVLREILGRRDGSTGSGDSATEDVPAATVRSVLAEILADMQPEARPRLAAYQTCGVCNSGYPTGGSCGTCAFNARMAAQQPTT